MWNKIDKTFLLNLPERRDRFNEVISDLMMHGIQHVLVEAIKHERGAYGLYLTLQKVFEIAEKEDLGTILIFEDDVKLIHGFRDYLSAALIEIGYLDWDMLYLGANVDGPLRKIAKCDYILECSNMLTTHAIVYSRQGWKKCLAEFRRLNRLTGEPEEVDMIYLRQIQSQGKCYVTNPILAIQRASKSDITENLDTFTEEELRSYYKTNLEDKFINRLKEIE